jgi:phosphoribosylanthranilate isomerase
MKVANTSSPDTELLTDIMEHFKPDYIQLDDLEAVGEIEKIKKKFNCKIIKTIYVSHEDDLAKVDEYARVADMFLFDAPHGNDLFVEMPESTFDWQILKNKTIPKKWILSGGLNKFNVLHAARVSGAKIVNASSTLESTPGIKDVHLIEEFIRTIRVESYR